MSSEEEKKKSGWYPGKYMRNLNGRRGSTNGGSDDAERKSLSSGQNRSHSPTNFEPYPINHDNVEIVVTAEGQDVAGTPSQSTKDHVIRYPAVARVKFRLLELKYLTIQAAKVSIELDGVASVFQNTDIPVVVEREFDLLDVTSDLKIEFRGLSIVTNNPVFGIVVVPITSCLSFAGAPLEASAKWSEIYPYYEKIRLLDSPKIAKFRSSLPEIPGSAMTKPSESLGFIKYEVEIIPLKGKSGLPLYFNPSVPRPMSMIKATENDAEGFELTAALNNARVSRDLERLKAVLFRPPALIAPFLTLPEVFLLIVVFGFMCVTFSAAQLPWVVYAVLLTNGLVANSSRKFAHISAWNEVGGPTGISLQTLIAEEGENRKSIAAPVPATGTISGNILRMNHTLQKQLAQVVHNLEVLNNIFTFADSRVSLIAYGILLGLTIVSSLWISIFSLGNFVFVVGSISFLTFASIEFLEDQIPQLHAKSLYHRHIATFRKIYGIAHTLWSKVPDELELIHRHIASLSVVKELGGEMNDSANNFAARAAAKEKEGK